MLRQYARGEDKTPVRHKDIERDIKSIGNATTTLRDLVNNNDVKIIFTVLAESVSRRMRNLGLKGTTLSIYVRDKKLGSFVRQCKLESATNVSGEIIKSAMALFVINYDWKMPIRSLGLSVTDFDFDYCSQFDFSKTVEKREKLEKIDTAVDALKTDTETTASDVERYYLIQSFRISAHMTTTTFTQYRRFNGKTCFGIIYDFCLQFSFLFDIITSHIRC